MVLFILILLIVLFVYFILSRRKKALQLTCLGILFLVIILVISLEVTSYKTVFLEWEQALLVDLGKSKGKSFSCFLILSFVEREFHYSFYQKSLNDMQGGWNNLLAKDVIILKENRKNAFLSRFIRIKKYPDWFSKFIIPNCFFVKKLSKYAIHTPLRSRLQYF